MAQTGEVTADVSLTWRPPHETDLHATIGSLRRGPGDPTFFSGAGGSVWRTTRTETGPATVRISRLPDGSFRCDAWGPGADAAAQGAPMMLGADDDASTFVPGLPVLADAHRRNAGLHVPRTGRVFEALVPAILEQKVITLQAHASWRRLVVRFGEAAPGPVPRPMHVVPAPDAWRAIPTWDWHRAGVDPKRAATIQRLAPFAARIDEAADMSPTDAAARLTHFAGVGAWTAAEVAQRALGDADAVSVGDYHLANYVGHALHGRDMTDDEMLETLAPWPGHRYRVIRLLMAAGLRGRPRRGPRLAFVDHRAI